MPDPAGVGGEQSVDEHAEDQDDHHIKEFSRKIADKQGKGAGFGVKLLEGDVNWPIVMKALDDAGYNSWTTIEQPGGSSPEGMKDLNDRLIKIHNS